MTPGRIEAIKIKANYLNGLGIAVFAVGGFAPVVAAVNSGSFSLVGAFLSFTSVIISIALQLFARYAAQEIDNVA